LNPKKCTLGVPRGKLLVYIITGHDIEANPDKILAIAEMGQVRNVRTFSDTWGDSQPSDVSCLDWGNAAPLYKLLKKSDSFCWTEEMEKALDELKEFITKLLVLASLEPGETLLLYIATTTKVISAALVVEQDEPGHIYKVQRLSKLPRGGVNRQSNLKLT
jgi:hypothetical protein